MSSLRKLRPYGIVAATGLALLVTAGCKTGTYPADPAAAPTQAASPDATPTSALGDAEPGQNGAPQAGGGQGAGGSGGDASGGSGGGTSSWPTPEDCVAYDPDAVTLEYGDGLYQVKDGATVVLRVWGAYGETVGEKALALAKRFRKHCYIGRDNGREDENAYVFDYWRGPSGLTPAIAEQEDDCSSYDPSDLTVDDMGSGYGWRVRENDHVLHVFDNEADARSGKLVLSKYHQICVIGSSNDDDNAELINYML